MGRISLKRQVAYGCRRGRAGAANNSQVAFRAALKNYSTLGSCGSAEVGSQELDAFKVWLNAELQELSNNDAALKRGMEGLEVLWGRAGQPVGGLLLEAISLIREKAHGSENHPFECRLPGLAQLREKFQTKTVALKNRLLIGVVLANGQAVFSCVAPQGFFGEREKGAKHHDGGVGRRRRFGFHAGQPLGARATKQAQKEKLHLIVGMVGGGEGWCGVLASNLGKESVAQVAGRHFQGEPPGLAPGSDVPAAHLTRPAQTGGEATHVRFIQIAGRTAQLMIKVGHNEAQAQGRGSLMEGVQQYGGIESAGDCHHERASPFEGCTVTNGVYNLRGQMAHARLV